MGVASLIVNGRRKFVRYVPGVRRGIVSGPLQGPLAKYVTDWKLRRTQA